MFKNLAFPSLWLDKKYKKKYPTKNYSNTTQDYEFINEDIQEYNEIYFATFIYIFQ